jgi:hypothetical protein
MSLARCPELGSKPITLTVKMKRPAAEATTLGDSLKDLFRAGTLTDIDLTCCEKRYPAHCVVLAARSPVLKEQIRGILPTAAGSRPELRLQDIHNPEAVKFMLDFLYEMDDAEWAEYNPRTQDINKDVLMLARIFQLPGLTERAQRWLAKDLTTGNVVERLSICDEFCLDGLREKILEQLTLNRQALSEVANSPQIMTYPSLMQAMLQHAAAAPDANPQPTKRGRKAGA